MAMPGMASRNVESHVGDSTLSTVQRIVTKLLSRDYLLGLPLSWTDCTANASGQDVPNSIADVSADLMTQMVGLCLDDLWGVTLFLHKSDIRHLVEKYQSDLTAGEESEFDLIDTLLLSILVAWGAAANANEDPTLAYAMSTHVIDIYHTVLSEPLSIPKFLALVCMSQYTFKIGLPQCSAVLAQTVSLVQSLNLHLEAGLACIQWSGGTMTQVKRACWVLFSLDKIYAMRWRTFSLLLASSTTFLILPLRTITGRHWTHTTTIGFRYGVGMPEFATASVLVFPRWTEIPWTIYKETQWRHQSISTSRRFRSCSQISRLSMPLSQPKTKPRHSPSLLPADYRSTTTLSALHTCTTKPYWPSSASLTSDPSHHCCASLV
ncbi:hypothetical protein GGR57DRAFT_44741 [Xylariaceae sp. FL1272]|nr:hypothetical protein GGR57DRAFT_44741 [Xylariaceae sp. FL1272]